MELERGWKYNHPAACQKYVFHAGKELHPKNCRDVHGVPFGNTYTKDKILELYVNSIYFGDGYYCVRDASRGYFGKEPIDMTGYESTLLAGIPNAPSVYSLTANPDLAKQRQQYVIQQMVRYGYISEDEGKELSQ